MNKKNRYIYFLFAVILAVSLMMRLEVPEKTITKTNNLAATYLPIPQLLDDKNPDPNIADYELRVQNGNSIFLDNKNTKTMGYNGNYLGPVVVVRRDELVNMHVKNELNEDTSVHWHGLKVSGKQDGGPHQVVKPNEVWEPSFRVNQTAATLWFHPHVIGSTASQVYYGLAGLMIVEDDISEKLNIPKTYGVNDIPLIIQDRSFSSDGTFDYNNNMMNGVYGDKIIVNGAITPTLEVKQVKMRFRIVNGSNARNYNLVVDNGAEFYQIASDGGFLEKPVGLRNLFISPGERAEIIVDFAKFKEGQTVAMTSGDSQVMIFKVSGPEQDDTSIPSELTEVKRMEFDSSTPIKRIELNGMGHMVTLNGRKFNMGRIDDTAEVGRTEIWEITNIGSMMHSMGHPFHVHGVQFQVLSRSSMELEDNEMGWKDTVFVDPNETVRIIVQFQEKGVFMYHCHILEHEEAGMMAQIEVN